MDDCLTPSFPSIGSYRLFYITSGMAIIIASISLQIIFILVCQKMKGWKSEFAFYLLQVMAFFSLLNYVGWFASYIHGLILFDSLAFARALGSNYQGSYLAFVATNLFLTIHRFFYTLFPLRAHRIITEKIEKIGIAFAFIFYGLFLAITLSQLASMEFCAADFYFFSIDTPLYPMIFWTNEIANYAVGIKGSLTFKRNSEIRMTAQLLFFAYWQFGTSALLSVSEFWCRTLDGYSVLIYYDVLILPYMIFNESVKKRTERPITEEEVNNNARDFPGMYTAPTTKYNVIRVKMQARVLELSRKITREIKGRRMVYC